MYRHNRLFAPDCETLLRHDGTYMHILYCNLYSSIDSNIQPIGFYFLEPSSPFWCPVAEGPSLGLLTFDILPEIIPVWSFNSILCFQGKKYPFHLHTSAQKIVVLQYTWSTISSLILCSNRDLLLQVTCKQLLLQVETTVQFLKWQFKELLG